MKSSKLFVLLIASLLLAFLLPSVYAEPSNVPIPAPFGKVKEMAMTATPDADGDYITEKIFRENGARVSYLFIYCTKEKTIWLGRSGFGFIIYGEATGEFFTIYSNFLISINKDIAIQKAYEIFREFVLKGTT